MKTLNEMLVDYEFKGFVFTPGMNSAIRRGLKRLNPRAYPSLSNFDIFCMEDFPKQNPGKTRVAVIVRRKLPGRFDVVSGRTVAPPLSHEVVEFSGDFMDRKGRVSDAALDALAESIDMMVAMVAMEIA